VNIEEIILSVSILVNVIVGLLPFLSNSKSQTNRLFALYALSLAGWSLFSYLSSEPSINQLVLIRLVMFFVVFMNTMFYLLITVFPNSRFNYSKRHLMMSVFSVVVMIVTVSPYLFTNIEIQNGNISPVPGPGMLFFLIHSLLFVVSSLRLLIRKLKNNKGLVRTQLKLILIGSILLFTLLPLTNFILPVVFKKSGAVSYSSIYATFFAASISYAILKHRLFNLRSIAARAMTYGMSVLALAGLFSISTLTVAQLFVGEQVPFDQQISNIVIATILVFVFQPIRDYFNKVTTKIFYRESYSTQELLNNLSSLLATKIDLQSIINESSKLIAEKLRPIHLRFVVFKDGDIYQDYRLEKPPKVNIDRDFLASLNEILVVRDNVENKSVVEILDAYDAEILLKLHTNDETVGVILIGPKQTGTIYSQQDIDVLNISEQELAIAVQNSRYFEQIQKFNIKLTKEVETATAELRKSNEKLKALDEAKDEFISMASHQLRTPLTSVKGYVSMIIDGDVGDVKPEQKSLLEEAFASSQRMVYLIADLLNVSRLKTGKFVIEPSEINLASIVKEEIHQLKQTANSRKLRIKYDKPSNFPKIWLDETKIRQVIMNFIDNAIYYTPAGGSIEIQLIAKQNSIEYKVKDDGIGVPKVDQPKLFTKFFRAGNARKARPDGTGLGLYMAQRVVSAQGGSVLFDSKEGQGSTFGFTFPLSSVNSRSAVLSHSESLKLQVESDV
jgi:signal transduction histidine kinase